MAVSSATQPRPVNPEFLASRPFTLLWTCFIIKAALRLTESANSTAPTVSPFFSLHLHDHLAANICFAVSCYFEREGDRVRHNRPITSCGSECSSKLLHVLLNEQVSVILIVRVKDEYRLTGACKRGSGLLYLWTLSVKRCTHP